MADAGVTAKRRMGGVRRWIRFAFVLWAITSTSWLANSMRTQGVDGDLMRSGNAVTVVDGETTVEFLPANADGEAG